MVLKTVSEYAEGKRKSKPRQRLYDRPITVQHKLQNTYQVRGTWQGYIPGLDI